MSFLFLRYRIKCCIKPGHPHLFKMKAFKSTQFQGQGRWTCVGPVVAPVRGETRPRMRRAYGETQREAWETYMALYSVHPKPRCDMLSSPPTVAEFRRELVELAEKPLGVAESRIFVQERILGSEVVADLRELHERGLVLYRTTTTITPVAVIQLTSAGKAHFSNKQEDTPCKE